MCVRARERDFTYILSYVCIYFHLFISSDTELLSPPSLIPSAHSLKVGQSFNLTCRVDVKPDTYVELSMVYDKSGSIQVQLTCPNV